MNTLTRAEPKAVVSPTLALGYICCSTHTAAPHPPFSAAGYKDESSHLGKESKWFSTQHQAGQPELCATTCAAGSILPWGVQCSGASVCVSAHPAQPHVQWDSKEFLSGARG